MKKQKLLNLEEYLILKENLKIAEQLRICAKTNQNYCEISCLLQRANQLEVEYKELKKKYKNYKCIYIL